MFKFAFKRLTFYSFVSQIMTSYQWCCAKGRYIAYLYIISVYINIYEISLYFSNIFCQETSLITQVFFKILDPKIKPELIFLAAKLITWFSVNCCLIKLLCDFKRGLIFIDIVIHFFNTNIIRPPRAFLYSHVCLHYKNLSSKSSIYSC